MFRFRSSRLRREYVDYYFHVEQGRVLCASAEEEALYQFSVVVVRDGGLWTRWQVFESLPGYLHPL